MTQENKELLLIDLSEKLPYGIICQLEGVKKPQRLTKIDIDDFGKVSFSFSWKKNKGHKNEYVCSDEQIKPYLRPMSSMTEEEIEEFSVLGVGIHLFKGPLIPSYDTLDWLNAHHFDYRGLIEKGLAIEAPKGMYKID